MQLEVAEEDTKQHPLLNMVLFVLRFYGLFEYLVMPACWFM